MSYLTMSDLGRRGRPWGGRWRGGAYPYYVGGGGWYPYDTLPIAVVDPIGPSDEIEDPNEDKIRAIAEAVRKELAKKGSGMGQMYLDIMGPGSRDADIDRIARDDEIVDEAISAQKALAMRQAAGAVNMSDAPTTGAPATVKRRRGGPGRMLVTGAAVALGVAAGWWACSAFSRDKRLA